MEALTYLFIVLASMLAHEVGHLVAFRAIGVPVKSCSVGFGPPLLWKTDRSKTRWALRLLPLGGYCEPVKQPAERMTPQENIFVSLSGPAVNAIIAAFLFCLTTAIDSDMLRFAAYLNAFGAAFNLLPFAPLDGGHVLLARIRMARGRGEDYDDDPVYISTALAGFALFIAANAAFFMAPDWWSPFEPAQGMSAEGENAKGG